MADTLSTSQIEKLGNTMIYLSKNVGEFGITKALKILFLLEENSIKEYGVPFFGFEFKVWQFGPVVAPIYIELNDGPKDLLARFVKKVPYGDEYLFEALTDFNDDEFSENDLQILKEMVDFSRHKTASEFVAITHGPDSLWRKTAKSHNVIYDLEKKKIKTTEIPIDFSPLFENDDFIKSRYEDYLDFQKFNQYLKA
jgi:uncharacterized phage-associated protein